MAEETVRVWRGEGGGGEGGGGRGGGGRGEGMRVCAWSEKLYTTHINQ